MRTQLCLLAGLILAMPAVSAAAAGPDDAVSEAAFVERIEFESLRLAEAEPEGETLARREDQLRLELEEAQAQLEDAAKEVARLSVELSGGAMERVVRYFHETGRKAMLGITINDAQDKAGAAAPGVRVYGVSPGGPAEKGGLRAGDIIVAMNDQPMLADDQGPADKALLAFMKTVEPGDQVRVRYTRDGQMAETRVTTEAFEAEAFAFSFKDEGGDLFDFQAGGAMGGCGFCMHDGAGSPGQHLHLVPMTAALGAYFGTEDGLLVIRAPDGDDMPLQEGDVILRVNGEPVDSAERVLTRLQAAGENASVTLEIVRQRETLSVQVARSAGWDSHRRVTRRIEKRRIDPDSGEVRITVEEEQD